MSKDDMSEMESEQIVSRIWNHDYTVWKPDPTEISNRLGWLHIAEIMKRNICYIEAVDGAARADGYTHALLLGMGGSSLAPELFSVTFGGGEGHLNVAVLDSTDPGAVSAYQSRLDPKKTIFIVSTKSGGTVETLSFFKFFYNWVAKDTGEDNPGDHFIAITDPGSGLADLAKRYSFREIFLNDSTIGGRYSALSYFGLVPAVFAGVDTTVLLDRATAMMNACKEGDESAGPRLGVVMGKMALIGRDKLTLITSPPIAAFGAWVEQLIAESTGKEGTGIVPVDGEKLGSPDVYGDDRLFVYLRLNGDDTHDAAVQSLMDAGQPVVQINLQDKYDLGGEFFRWEMATAVAGYFLNINPFDQPNVESAKQSAREMVAAYEETGELPVLTSTLRDNGITVYANLRADSPKEALNTFLGLARPGDYIALQAYVQPTEETTAALQQLRIQFRDRLKLATTVGYGPRFLHSTGQLHKGDAGKGLFIQITNDAQDDIPIPKEAGSQDSSITFGVLKIAQALGDRRALLDAGRRFIRFHLETDVVSGLKSLQLKGE